MMRQFHILIVKLNRQLTNLERLRHTNPDKFALQADELKKCFR
jgi:hypothetical protein